MNKSLASWGITIDINPPADEPGKPVTLVARNLNHNEAVTFAITIARQLHEQGIKDFVKIHPEDADRYSVYRIPEGMQ